MEQQDRPVPAAAGAAPGSPAAARPARLIPQLREAIRVRHYALRTEQAYVDWVRRFVHFHGLRHPRELGAAHVEAFLTHLACCCTLTLAWWAWWPHCSMAPG